MKVTAEASYFAVTAIFNSTEKICSSNLTENLFDALNAFFDGSYFNESTSMK